MPAITRAAARRASTSSSDSTEHLRVIIPRIRDITIRPRAELRPRIATPYPESVSTEAPIWRGASPAESVQSLFPTSPPYHHSPSPSPIVDGEPRIHEHDEHCFTNYVYYPPRPAGSSNPVWNTTVVLESPFQASNLRQQGTPMEQSQFTSLLSSVASGAYADVDTSTIGIEQPETPTIEPHRASSPSTLSMPSLVDDDDDAEDTFFLWEDDVPLKFIGTPLFFRHPIMIGKQGSDGIHFVFTTNCPLLVFIPDEE
jgi:hypothetical protein